MGLRWEESGRFWCGYDETGRYVSLVANHWRQDLRIWSWQAKYWGDRPSGTGPSLGRDTSLVGDYWPDADAAKAAAEQAHRFGPG